MCPICGEFMGSGALECRECGEMVCAACHNGARCCLCERELTVTLLGNGQWSVAMANAMDSFIARCEAKT